MKLEQKIVLGLGVLLVVAAAFWEGVAGLPKRVRTEITQETLQIGLNRPTIWIFVNDSDTNSRHWSDFMGRSSNVINIPLLNLCYATIAKHNGADYRIEVIGGLQRVAELLGGWTALPTFMSSPKARVNQPEEDWIRAAVLAKYGGLWLSPSVICMKPFGPLPHDKIVSFGQDDVPMYGSAVPGFRALWSPKPAHPVFVEWERRCRERLDFQTGGRQSRGDAKSDWIDLADGTEGTDAMPIAELGRDPKTGKKLDLEHLLAAGTGGRLPFAVPECTVYVPIPYADLLDRRHFGWILRNSEEQIMGSDIAIRYLFEKSLSNN